MDLLFDALSEAVRLLVSGDPYLWGIVGRSLLVSSSAVLLGLIFGVPLGAWLGLARFRGRGLAIAIVNTGLALPPVVVGLFVYMMLSRQGALGSLGWLFTIPAMISAQFILAAPYVAAITLAAVQSVPPELRLQARAVGASRLQAVWLHLREARLSLMAAVAAGFGAVISEVGAVTMVGGNIADQTRVITTAIVLETRRGRFAAAMALGLILLAFAFAANVFITRIQQAEPRRRRPPAGRPPRPPRPPLTS
ncbi:MAG: ABC transporter permease [Candidatus Palauibacterales bacterium]|nr:ABC transporter permease [Candidatus Palauibacterales bacterium]